MLCAAWLKLQRNAISRNHGRNIQIKWAAGDQVYGRIYEVGSRSNRHKISFGKISKKFERRDRQKST